MTIHVLAELCCGYCQWEELHRHLETIDSYNNDWTEHGLCAMRDLRVSMCECVRVE